MLVTAVAQSHATPTARKNRNQRSRYRADHFAASTGSAGAAVGRSR